MESARFRGLCLQVAEFAYFGGHPLQMIFPVVADSAKKLKCRQKLRYKNLLGVPR